jgi:hypothetical protein
LFTGPNNLDRIPEIKWMANRRQNCHGQLAVGNKADDYQIRDDISDQGAHQNRSLNFARRSGLFGQTQGFFVQQ